MPFYTIVIPLYNKAPYIAQTLKGVLGQTFGDFEVIIVNDGSTDDGEQVVKRFDDPRIHYYLRENKGVSAARNFGVTMARADYIAFLDADDYWYPDFLQTIHRNIHRFADQRVFATAIEIETAHNIVPAQYSIRREHPVEVVDFFSASTKECVLWTSSAVFHKSVFETAGLFDVTMPSGQDTDLWMRIGLHYPIVFDWKILARYVFDAQSLSRGSRYLSSKINFARFDSLAATRPNLKRYLDQNRFSLAVKSRLAGDEMLYRKLKTAIDARNLNTKRRVLLQMPRFALAGLVRLNRWMANNGLANSVFR